MSVDPTTVMSPKDRLDPPLTIVHETVDWSMATAFWDKRRRVLLRWNGDEDRRLGNPVSRGYATWFVLPEELEWSALAVADPTKRLEAATWLAGPDLP